MFRVDGSMFRLSIFLKRSYLIVYLLHDVRGVIIALISYGCHYIGKLYRGGEYLALPNSIRDVGSAIPPPFAVLFVVEVDVGHFPRSTCRQIRS